MMALRCSMIVGGSGPCARPMQPDWVRNIRDRCADAKVPVFFKQWGGVRKSTTGRVLDGKTYDAGPNRRSVEPPSPEVRKSLLVRVRAEAERVPVGAG